MNNHEMDTHNEEALASRTPEPGEGHERTTAEVAEPRPANVVSIRKIEANRANARQSTGPRTDAGKRASRMNAVRHGLLAQAVPITKGDYKEDPRKFAQLLEGLHDEFTPVGMAEDLEVQTIARCYWRKMRAARCEHGAIRKRSGGVREDEEREREKQLHYAREFGADLEQSADGIQYLRDKLEGAKQEVLSGTLAGECYNWLKERNPNGFPQPDATQVVQEGARRVLTADYRDQIVATIDEQLDRLALRHAMVVESEALNLESTIWAAALPDTREVDKLIRYETSNDRQLDRALQRLEAMQAQRRKQGDAPAEK